MFKKLVSKLLSKENSVSESEGFFLRVSCDKCGEQFNLFINKSYELSQNFEQNGSVTYFLKKTVFGVGCKNRILVNMQFDSAKNLLSRQIENGHFIED
jgi:hypothetical protein